MARTVDWTALRAPEGGISNAQGLRERKKREMRQRLSDTATEMFVQHGFDAVRVADVAEACGVSEKTVYNYFPNKESLLLDRWEATRDSLLIGLADPDLTPIQAGLRTLADELGALTSWMAAQEDPDAAGVLIQRFGTLISSTPALRAHQREMTDQLVAAAAEVIAGRSRTNPTDPEPQMAATALLGLWHIQSQSLERQLESVRTSAQIYQAVTKDVERAARVIEKGLSWPALVDLSENEHRLP